MRRQNSRVPALVEAVDGDVVAFAYYLLNYSTWLERQCIYLKDLSVRLAKECVDNGYGQLNWSVLVWSTPSSDFYAALGVKGGWPLSSLARTFCLGSRSDTRTTVQIGTPLGCPVSLKRSPKYPHAVTASQLVLLVRKLHSLTKSTDSP